MNKLKKKYWVMPLFYLILFTSAVFFTPGCSLMNGSDDDSESSIGVNSDDPSTLLSVSFTEPKNEAVGVPINRKISLTFSEEIDPSTITNLTLIVKGTNGTPVPGTVSAVDFVAKFAPANLLNVNTTYTVTITTGAKTFAGKSLGADYIWKFSTSTVLDTTSPKITFTLPLDGSANVAVNSQITATFNEVVSLDIPVGILAAIAPAQVFMVAGPGGTAVPGKITHVGLVAKFKPTKNLAFNTTYTCTISAAGAKDLADNPLSANVSWRFTTVSATPAPTAGSSSGGGGGGSGSPSPIDTLAPTVTFTDPAIGASGIAINKKIAATFSEGMDPTTITNVNFSMSRPGGVNVPGTVTYVGLIAKFTPASNLAVNTLYTCKVKTGSKDLAGNPLATDFIWSFTTAAVIDTTAPTVTLTDPLHNANGVATNKKISATFSEGMDPETINNLNFTVADPDGDLIPGTVTFLGLIAKFTPTGFLMSNTNYFCAITTNVKDLADNPMAANFTWTFTTGATTDTTPPTVTLTDPIQGAVGVATNKKISATFSEGMDPATITNVNFKIAAPGGALIPGTVTFLGLVAKFTPTSFLASNTIYSCTVTTDVKDLADNPMAANFNWSFTTGGTIDTTPPTVNSTDPIQGAVGVATNKNISTTFSEGMDPATITNVNFKIAAPGGALIPGTVTFVGLVAKFNPGNLLSSNTSYSCTITTDVKDLAGNPMAANFNWSFTTGATADTTAPTVTLTNPIQGAINVNTTKKVAATFSEGMDPATITNVNFKITGPGGTNIPGTVVYLGMIATFTPNITLATNTLYLCNVSTGVTDLAGNALAASFTWSFTTGSIPQANPVSLGQAESFGSFGGGAGMTNQGIFTVINGDIGTTGASTMMTGFHDSGGNVYTETPSNKGQVNGIIYTATAPPGSDPGVIAGGSAGGAQTAYNNLLPAALPGGVDVSIFGGGAGELGGRTLQSGIYKSAPGSFDITLGDLTLDGNGDANAVWVFQMASTLKVGGANGGTPRSVLLINGAQAKNVFWQVGSAATINAPGGGTMVGTIIAQAGATFSTVGNVTLTTIDGRALGLSASVTLVNVIMNIPGA